MATLMLMLAVLFAGKTATAFHQHLHVRTAGRRRSASAVVSHDELPMLSLPLPMTDSTRVVISLPNEACEQLATSCNGLIASFRKIQARVSERERPQREPSLEFNYETGTLRVDFECNPNIYPDPFKAKVSMRLRSRPIKYLDITSEVALTTLVDTLRKALSPA